MLQERTREVADATRRPARLAAGVAGALFLLAGILGFVPGVTSDYASLALSGHYSEARLFGVFQVSVLHNLLHLLLGAAGLAAAWLGARLSRLYLLAGGLVYLALWLYGALLDLTTVEKLFGPVPSGTSLVSFAPADDWLRFLVAAGMLALYFLVRPARGIPE
ncbi:MAG TPA: DUF4383 domain-containing protein [Thermobifida alba]|nr:DUF4383 domain-containing protein [Thermobifida alba]